MDKVSDSGSRKRAEDVANACLAWRATLDEVSTLKKTGNTAATRVLLQSKFVPATDAYIQATQLLVDGEVAHVHAAQKEIKSMFSQLYVLGAALLVLAVVIAIVISQWLVRSISRGLQQAGDVAQRIGQGDLSQPVQVAGSDDIGQLLSVLSTMQDNLTKVVANVRQGSNGVSTASAEIASGNQDLSARTENQASALEETAASME